MTVYKGATFRIEGLEELQKNLDTLSKAASKAVLRNAVKAALKPMRDAAKANAPQGSTGNLAKGIVITTSLRKSQRRGFRDRSAVEAFVGPNPKVSPHAHLVEWGTGPRTLKKPRMTTLGGRPVFITHTGQMPANPYMRRAYDSTKKKAVEIFAVEVWNQLVKVGQRWAKQASAGKLAKSNIKALLR